MSSQTDTWTVGAGASYTPTKNVEVRLGGSVGVLTSRTGRSGTVDSANIVSYDYGNDLVAAFSASLKIKF